LQTPISKERIKRLILEVVEKEKPENTQKLMTIMLQKYTIHSEPTKLTQLLIELENEGKIQFAKPTSILPSSAREYIFSQMTLWYWVIIALSILTTISVITLSNEAYPIVYVRNILGAVFIIFLPGYTFIKALFPTSVPIETGIENLNKIERIVLSIFLSISLVVILGLVLNYTPWAIRLMPVTLSLLTLTVVFATIAVIREYQLKVKLPNKLLLRELKDR
jgi:hypothetical protein